MKLGEQGDRDVTHAGDGPMRGRKRDVSKSRIAKRCAEFKDDHCPRQGVVPLNAGFFRLERMRAVTVANAKVRAKRKTKLRGK